MSRRVAAAWFSAAVLYGCCGRACDAASAPRPIAPTGQPPHWQAAAGDPSERLYGPDQMLAAQKPIGLLTTNIGPSEGPLPTDHAVGVFAQQGTVLQQAGACRGWADRGFCWDAPALCHGPLYFEEVNLERHGYSFGLAQPLVSAAHFFGRVPALPYLSAADPPCQCVSTLGYRRPGSWTPPQRCRAPLSLRGGVLEAATVAGLIFAIP